MTVCEFYLQKMNEETEKAKEADSKKDYEMVKFHLSAREGFEKKMLNSTIGELEGKIK